MRASQTILLMGTLSTVGLFVACTGGSIMSSPTPENPIAPNVGLITIDETALSSGKREYPGPVTLQTGVLIFDFHWEGVKAAAHPVQFRLWTIQCYRMGDGRWGCGIDCVDQPGFGHVDRANTVLPPPQKFVVWLLHLPAILKM